MKISAEQMQALYRHDFGSFARFAFHELHPSVEYLHNWHIDVLTNALRKVEAGEITRLIITLPPRMLKSHCASIAFPAWVLGRNPAKKIVCLSGSYDLSSDLENSFYQLVQSNRYRALFPSFSYTMSSKRIITPHGGFRKSACMDSSLMGVGADIVIIDDPLSAQKAQDEPERSFINQAYDQNVYQRMNDKKTGAIIIVMQRLHEDDLCGHVLRKSDGWHHINLPAFALKDKVWHLPRGQTFTHHKWEALHPEREPLDDLMDVRDAIGAKAFSSQYLQLQAQPQYGAVAVPKQYGSYEEWCEKDPSAVFEATLMHEHGLVIVPEALSIEEWQEKYETT